MPDSHESCRIIRPASHTTALGELFIADEGGRAQGGSSELGKFTELVLAFADGTHCFRGKPAWEPRTLRQGSKKGFRLEKPFLVIDKYVVGR
jgi:hypothetical protein